MKEPKNGYWVPSSGVMRPVYTNNCFVTLGDYEELEAKLEHSRQKLRRASILVGNLQKQIELLQRAKDREAIWRTKSPEQVYRDFLKLPLAPMGMFDGPRRSGMSSTPLRDDGIFTLIQNLEADPPKTPSSATVTGKQISGLARQLLARGCPTNFSSPVVADDFKIVPYNDPVRDHNEGEEPRTTRIEVKCPTLTVSVPRDDQWLLDEWHRRLIDKAPFGAVGMFHLGKPLVAIATFKAPTTWHLCTEHEEGRYRSICGLSGELSPNNKFHPALDNRVCPECHTVLKGDKT